MRRLLYSCVVPIVLTLTACLGDGSGGGGAVSTVPVDSLKRFKTQKVVWQACDPTILGADDSQWFNQLGSRVTCADIQVPLDHHHPDKGELSIALLRVAASNPVQRKGSILLNPGGPGGDGLMMALYFSLFGELSGEGAGTQAGMAMETLAAHYDVVGFSPRGIGASSQLSCQSNELFRPENDLAEDRSAENIDNALYNARLTAKTCKKNPLTAYINSEQTARDMDMVREILGDKELNYVGYSYGTWLGVEYAKRFPQRVGRMVLDSNMDVTRTFNDASIAYALGHQRVIDEVLAAYAVRHANVFNLGNTVQHVQSLFASFPSALRSIIRPALISAAKSSRFAEGGVSVLMAAQGVAPFFRQDSFELARVLEQIDGMSFSPDVALDAKVHQIASVIVSQYSHSLTLTIPQTALSFPISLPGRVATHFAIVCNDTPSLGNPQFWVEKGNELATQYPLLGGSLTQNVCAYWGAPTVTSSSLATARQAKSILMVQSEFDAPTPREGAEQTLAALPNARMVFVQNEYSHGVFPYGTACVDDAVVSYLLNGAVETLPRKTLCQGKPLLRDEASQATATDKDNPGAARSLEQRKRLEQREKVREKIHEIIERNAIKF